MFPVRLRVTLIILFTLVGAVLLAYGQTYGFLFLLSSLLLLAAYFREGTVYLAFRALKRNDADKAGRLLAQIRKPEWLAPQQKAYYHFIKGHLCFQAHDLENARTHLLRAALGRLRTQNDRSITHLALAELNLKLANLTDAREHLVHAKQLPHKPELEDTIAALELQLGIKT